MYNALENEAQEEVDLADGQEDPEVEQPQRSVTEAQANAVAPQNDTSTEMVVELRQQDKDLDEIL